MRDGAKRKRPSIVAIVGGVLFSFCVSPKVFGQLPGSQCDQVSQELFGASYSVKKGSGEKPTIKEPKKKRDVRPDLPTHWPQECKSPIAIHEALLAPSGKIERVWTLKSPCPQVDRAITLAIRQWEYSPTLVDKRAVPVCITISTLVDLR